MAKSGCGRRIGRFVYMILVLALGLAVNRFLMYVWNQCGEYELKHPTAVIAEALENERKRTGLDLECSMIPKPGSDGSSLYTFTLEDNPVAEVTVGIERNGIMGLAFCRLDGIKCLKCFNITIWEDCIIKSGDLEISWDVQSGGKLPDVMNSLASVKGINAPAFQKRTVDNVYVLEDIHVFRGDSELALIGQEDGSWLAVEFSEGKRAAAIKKRAAYVSKTYACYISGDAEWDTLAACLMKGAPLIKTLSSMDVKWYWAHKSVDFSGFMMSEPIELGNDFVLVNTSFTFNTYFGSRVRHVPTQLCLVLHLDKDGVWRTAAMATNNQYVKELSEYK